METGVISQCGGWRETILGEMIEGGWHGGNDKEA